MPTPSALPVIAVSLGDPAGVGAEIAMKALLDPAIRSLARWILIGEAWMVQRDGKPIGFAPEQITTNFSEVDPNANVVLLDSRLLGVDEFEVGKVSAVCGRASLKYVDQAVAMCLENQAAAMVTSPICKEAVSASGAKGFCGHTEYIAEMCGAPDSRLMLFNEKLCVVHVSTHVSLSEAAKLSIDRICRTIELGHAAMQRMTGKCPRIAVCGINPHAGENGMFGNEETEFIVPAIERIRSQGIACEGPLPADALFMQAVRGSCDLIVAMYHDQGHVPMKMFDFEHTANVTLGLPILRVSVDHGTAFDIAGKNQASSINMKTVMQLTAKWATA